MGKNKKQHGDSTSIPTIVMLCNTYGNYGIARNKSDVEEDEFVISVVSSIVSTGMMTHDDRYRTLSGMCIVALRDEDLIDAIVKSLQWYYDDVGMKESSEKRQFAMSVMSWLASNRVLYAFNPNPSSKMYLTQMKKLGSVLFHAALGAWCIRYKRIL